MSNFDRFMDAWRTSVSMCEHVINNDHDLAIECNDYLNEHPDSDTAKHGFRIVVDGVEVSQAADIIKNH